MWSSVWSGALRVLTHYGLNTSLNRHLIHIRLANTKTDFSVVPTGKTVVWSKKKYFCFSNWLHDRPKSCQTTDPKVAIRQIQNLSYERQKSCRMTEKTFLCNRPLEFIVSYVYTYLPISKYYISKYYVSKYHNHTFKCSGTCSPPSCRMM
jgi:hypothetical protein